MEPKKYLKLNDIEAYKISYTFSNYVWEVVIKLDLFSKKTVGEQFTRSIDSISANIEEGFRRYSKKDKIRFFRISLGSVFESLDWNQKSLTRNLLNVDQYNFIFNELQKLPKSINSLISFNNNKLQI